MSSSEEPEFKYIDWPYSFFVFNCPRCGYANAGYDTYCDKCGGELPLWVRKKNLEEAWKEERKYQAQAEEQQRLFKAHQEEWRRKREQQTYQQPTPLYELPQPSYTPPVFSSNDRDEWDEEDEDEDSEEWDDEEEEEYDEEEEEYIDTSPDFVTTSFSPAQAPVFQGPDRHQPAQGQSRLGRDIQTKRYVEVPQASRRQGLYLIGIQGMGKSVLIENLIIQDIKQHIGVCVLDPHGDLINAVLSRLPEHRVNDVIYLNITDYHYPFGLNLFTCSDPTNPFEVQKIVDQVIHVFEKLLGVSHDTPLILNYLKSCTRTLIANPGSTMADIPLLLQDGECRKKLVANVTDLDVQRFWRLHDQKKPADQNTDIASTLRRVDEFLQPLSRNIVGQSTSTIDIRQVMDRGKILLVKLDTTVESITELIGSLIIALFLNAAKSRADLPVNKRRQFNLYADEFQRFSTEDFATLLEEARKYGVATTIAHQNRGQLDSKNSQLETNLKDRTRSAANLIVFRINSKDAGDLAGEFDITPQEAWEEEIEPEWVEIVRPQRHERIEEQVVVEVEDDVKAIINNPVEYLLSVRGAHSSERVTEIIQNPLKKLEKWIELGSMETQRRIQKLFNLLNDLLIQVMWGNILIKSSLFIEKVLEIARAYNPDDDAIPIVV